MIVANKDMELKAYKILAETYKSMFYHVMDRARNCVQYKSNTPEDIIDVLSSISNPEKWDYSGLISKERQAVLDTVEYLLNDELTEITKRKPWQPSR